MRSLIFLHFKTTFIFSFMQIGFSKTIATPKMVLCNNDFSENSSFCQILRNNFSISLSIVSFSKLLRGHKTKCSRLIIYLSSKAWPLNCEAVYWWSLSKPDSNKSLAYCRSYLVLFRTLWDLWSFWVLVHWVVHCLGSLELYFETLKGSYGSSGSLELFRHGILELFGAL